MRFHRISVRTALAVLALTLTAGTLSLLFATDASATTASTWYWSPGYCKSQLNNKGVSISDGRYFYPAQSYCIGGGGANCEWFHGQRQYNRFTVVMRGNDGIVRRMILNTTGKSSWSGNGLKIIDRDVTDSLWRKVYGDLTWELARQENRKGCG
jgi:hypothetical protein